MTQTHRHTNTCIVKIALLIALPASRRAMPEDRPGEELTMRLQTIAMKYPVVEHTSAYVSKHHLTSAYVRALTMTLQTIAMKYPAVCVCVCVCERERERESTYKYRSIDDEITDYRYEIPGFSTHKHFRHALNNFAEDKEKYK